MSGYNTWVLLDGLIIVAVVALVLVAGIDEWRSNADRERAHALRERLDLEERPVGACIHGVFHRCVTYVQVKRNSFDPLDAANN